MSCLSTPLAGQFGKLAQWDQVVAFFTFLSQQLDQECNLKLLSRS